MRRIAAVVLAAAFLAVAGCAHTQAATKKTVAHKATVKQQKEFAKVQDLIHDAFQAIPQRYGADPVGEMEGIEMATAKMQAAEAALTPDLKGMMAYPTLTTNLATLKEKIAESKLLQHCSATRRKILVVHHAGHKATAAQLKALEDAVAALAKFEPASHADVVAPWKAELARIEKENDKIVPLRTQIPGPPLTKPERARYDKTMGPASKAANAALATLVTAAKKPGPLPKADVEALADAAAKVKTVDPKAAHYYTHRLEALELEGELTTGDTASAKAFAARLGGTVAASGKTRGRRIRVRVKGAKDDCYTLFAPAKTRFGRARAAAAHPYTIDDATYVGMAATGLCLTRATRVELTARVEERHAPYVVVAIPRAKMPLFLVTYLAVDPGDPCDIALWKDEWLHPIPGTVVWGGSAPFLVTKVSPPGETHVGLSTASGGSVRATKLQLVDDPPLKVKFTTPVFFPGCRGSRSRRGIDKRFTTAVKAIRAAWTSHPIRAPFDRAGEMYDHGRAWVDGTGPLIPSEKPKAKKKK